MLTYSHIEYVLHCMSGNTTKVKNIKKYLLAALFNAPSTMNGYYQAEVNHDMRAGNIGGAHVYFKICWEDIITAGMADPFL